MTRVGTYNIFAHDPAKRAATALQRFAPLVGIGGLQEEGAPTRIDDLKALPNHDYTHPHGAAPPIIWRADEFTKVAAVSVLVAKGRRVGRIPGFKSTLPDYHATVLRLTRIRDHTPISVLNFHTVAHVEIAGRARPGERSKMYAESLHRLCELALIERDYAGYNVLVLGDWNASYTAEARRRHPSPRLARAHFEAVGMRSMWAALPLRDVPGTHGNRPIDGVWTFKGLSASEPHVPDGFRGLSDHLPAIANFHI